jgi:hypothetical protein
MEKRIGAAPAVWSLRLTDTRRLNCARTSSGEAGTMVVALVCDGDGELEDAAALHNLLEDLSFS